MTERRFFLAEVDEGCYLWDKAITESELKRRIDRIIALPRPYRWQSMDVDIDILLNGDGEKGEDGPPN